MGISVSPSHSPSKTKWPRAQIMQIIYHFLKKYYRVSSQYKESRTVYLVGYQYQSHQWIAWLVWFLRGYNHIIAIFFANLMVGIIMFASLMPPIFGGIMPHAGDLNAGSRAVTQNRTDSKDQISNISKYQASPLNTTMIFASSFYNFSLKYEVNWSRYN